jgi:hypothetical protein
MDSHGIFPAASCSNSVITRTEHKAKLSIGFRVLLLVLLTLAIFPELGRSQTISATLSGFVYDPVNAALPNAKITLINEASKDKRTTVSNGSGYFSFTAVPAGTYWIKVEHTGFDAFEEKGIELHPSDQRNLTNIKLQVGSVEETITVTASSSTIPTGGDRTVLINSNDIKHLPVEGRDVTELIKTLPGFAQIAQGTAADNLAPDPGSVSGQTNSYAANGTTPEGISILSDGVNITDPGNGSSSDQVINMDSVQEVQIQTSNFGADSAKGPIVINAVGKSGGSEYHGSLYVHGRTYQMNTQDWFSKNQGNAKPSDRYIYPGGTFGGPVKIPGTNFNHNKKLVFFVSGEDYIQKNVYAYGSAASATINALVPTDRMRGIGTGGIADFSEQELTNYFGGIDPGATYYGLVACSPGGALSYYSNICNIPSGNLPGSSPDYTTNPITAQGADGPPIGGGQFSTHFLDPGAMAMINNVMPRPNMKQFPNGFSGNAPVTSLFNYQHVNLLDNSSYQARAKVDYAFSDSAKVSVVYNFQHSNSRNPQSLFYSPQQAFGEINTPSGILGEDFSNTASLNFTKIFSASLTNELYAGINLNYGHNGPGIKGANLSSTIGYPYQGIFPTLQYPQFDDYGNNGLPLALFPDYSSPVFQHKFIPNGGDNLTKVIKTHTIKVGLYVERITANQTDLNTASNGQIEQYYEGPGLCTSVGQTNCVTFGQTTSGRIYEPTVVIGSGTSATTKAYANYPGPGNNLAAFMLGEIFQFNQYNFQANSDLYYWTVDTYATDSWKASKKLTFDYGFRLGHVGPWQDAHGLGMAVWDPSLYASQVSVTKLDSFSASVANPGFTWHAIDSSVPNSGAGSTFAFFSPRFGVAYDLRGNGKTVLRGGIGAYRSHDSWNDINQTQATSQGQIYASLGGGGVMLRDIASIANLGAVSGAGGNSTFPATAGTAFGLSKGDNEQPLTYTYSFTISQQLKAATLFEISYQGNQTSHLLTQWQQGNPGDIENINSLPVGALFAPNPLTGAVGNPNTLSTTTLDDYRPYPYYNQVNVARHILYSNYNGLQASIKKTQGRGLYSVNYTWSKIMGIFGAYDTGIMIDSRNIRPNYGPLAYDRSHVVNGTYSYGVGKWVHQSRLLRDVANDWEISGIVNIQSGPNAQRVLNPGFNLGGLTGNSVQAFDGYSLNSVSLLGTPDVVLLPKLTCNPRDGVNHSQHQYINGSCFAVPDFGVNGPASEPYTHTPGYFNTDVRLGKDFKAGEKKDFQFQLAAFNVINRANYSFSSKFQTEQELLFTQPQGTTGLQNLKPPADFGYAHYRFGRRIAEISVKYEF